MIAGHPGQQGRGGQYAVLSFAGEALQRRDPGHDAKPQDRRGPVGKLLETVGGKLHHYFFAFGEYDVVLLYEAPDHTSAAAPLLTAMAQARSRRPRPPC
jgi:hypothetical protein